MLRLPRASGLAVPLPARNLASSAPSTSVTLRVPVSVRIGLVSSSTTPPVSVPVMTAASLTGVTVPVTPPVALFRPSVMVYSNAMLPLKSGAGVKISWPLLRVTEPLLIATVPPSAMVWPLMAVMVRRSPSTSVSLPSTLMVTVPSSATVNWSSPGRGAAFTTLLSVPLGEVLPTGSVREASTVMGPLTGRSVVGMVRVTWVRPMSSVVRILLESGTPSPFQSTSRRSPALASPGSRMMTSTPFSRSLAEMTLSAPSWISTCGAEGAVLSTLPSSVAVPVLPAGSVTLAVTV